MGIICQETNTISYVSQLICGKLVKIYDIKPTYSDIIDVWIDGEIVPGVGKFGKQLDSQYLTLQLISKNVPSGTAVLKLTVSTNPCSGVTCPDKCYGNDLYYQRCAVNTDADNIPTGTYECRKSSLKEVNSPRCVIPTHTLDLIVKPWAWYSPDSAAIDILTKISDINGAIINFFAEYGIIDYQYLNTQVLTGSKAGYEADKVIIRLNLKKTALGLDGLTGLAVQLTAAQILLIGVAIGLIIAFIGVIVGYKFGLFRTGITNAELINAGKDYMNKQIDDCETKICNIPEITLDQKAECIKNCIINNLTNWKDYYNKIYPDADHTPLDTGKAEIQICYDAYLASARTPADLAIFNNCSKTKGQDAVASDSDKVLIVYPSDANAGSKEKTTDWEKVLLIGGLGLAALIIITRR